MNLELYLNTQCYNALIKWFVGDFIKNSIYVKIAMRYTLEKVKTKDPQLFQEPMSI